ncbi:MAG TPA: pseudaminic acid synthase [Butyricimonas virosa]|nr:pseudaminic acid synthase [Butyricimonas virosa]
MDKIFIVAELSANHNHDYDLTVKTIKAMGEAGADAVKFQTYKPESLTLRADTPYFGPKDSGLWKGMTLYEIYTQGSLPYEWQPKLKKLANDLGMMCFSTPFDREGVDFMEEMNMPIYKIASAEINDVNLIEYVARKHKPMVLSTGMATLEDVELAVKTCRKAGNDDITLLKCTSEYPAPVEKANLSSMLDLKERFGVKVGISDHSMSNIIPIISVALGATMIEKHFIIDRSLGGIDSGFSLNKDEFASMVRDVRLAEKAMGEVEYMTDEETRLRKRSLFVVKDMEAGEIITEDCVRSVRPGYGMAPKCLKEILGKRVKCPQKAGMPLLYDDLDWNA